MLYIMRHGRTDWNNLNKLQGRTNIPLNEEGIKMAQKAAKEYENINFDICFCSPLIRAYDTARIMLEGRDIPIITDDRLSEMCFGIYEGIENSFSDESCPINVIFKEPEKYDFEIEGAESWDDLFKRTGDFLNDKVYPLLKEGKDILIVGHGAMNSSIVCQVRKIPIKDFWSAGIENCKLMKLQG